MEITPYLDSIRDDIVAASQLGDENLQEAVRRILPAVDPAVRLALIQAISDAAAEVTRQLQTESSDIIVRVAVEGRNPVIITEGVSFITFSPAAENPLPHQEDNAEEETASRTTVRIPRRIKQRADAAAAQAGMSLNSYIVDCIRQSLQTEQPTRRNAPSSTQTGVGRRGNRCRVGSNRRNI